MMNYRHPTTAERNSIKTCCDDIGAVEVLRIISAYVRNAHPDLTTGDELGSRINAVARDLDRSHLSLKPTA